MMDVSEEPVEIKIEPEINDILPFEDFDIDQFVDYLQNNEEIVNNHESPNNSVVNGHHPVDASNNSRQSESPDTKSFGNDSIKESLFYTCTVCHEVVESGRDLLKHVRTHTRLRNTDNFSRSSSNMKLHLKQKCCICSKQFSGSRELWFHEKTVHRYPPYNCRICDLKFNRLTLLKIHVLNHKCYQYVPDAKKFKSNSQSADVSGAFKVQTSQSLSSSISNRYPEPQIIRCRFCSKPFVKRSHLRKHEALHETSVKPKLLPDNDVNNHAAKALTLTPSLLSNLNKLANFNPSDVKDGIKPAILININTSSNDVNGEMKSQETPVATNSSGLMISSVKSVDSNSFYERTDNHSNSNSTSKATVVIRNGKQTVSLADVQCPICKKIVSQPFSLKVHLRTHTQEKPYKCEICDKCFSQSCNLRTHMKTHGTMKEFPCADSPFKCNICSQTFTRAAHLNTHMLTHKERKLYCYACEINFEENYQSYSQHMQTVHFVSMSKDTMKSRSKEPQNIRQQPEASIVKVEQEEQPAQVAKVFQVQSSSVANGQIPKLKITLKRDPPLSNIPKSTNDDDAGNESDSSSSSSSSNSSSSSSDSDSSNSSSSSSTSND